MSKVELLRGDCLEVLKSIGHNSIDAVVTDPPYGLRFMGKKWDYDVPKVDVWRECLRVLKPGGHMLVACGTRTQHRMAVNLEDAGFEIRDVITWLYGSGFPKSLNIGKHGGPEGFGTALKPACEFWTLVRKPLDGTVAANVRRWGVGGLNIDGCRVGNNPGHSYPNGPGGSNANTYGDFDKLRTLPVISTQGRFPANLILDEEAGEMLDAQSGSLKSGHLKPVNTAKKNAVFGAYGSANINEFMPSSGGASRFFYCAKASKAEREAGCDGMPEKAANTYNFTEDGSFTQNATAKSGIQVRETRKNNHPTVKPVKLMRYLCRLICPPGGIVLDPFMGSGSTGVAAKAEAFNFTGIELDESYFDIAQNRINSLEGVSDVDSSVK